MRRRRAGFTLLELSVVLWAVGVCMVAAGAILMTALRADQAGQATVNRLSGRAALAEQFRADVSGAESAPDELDDLAAGPACLLLQMPGGARIAYRWENGSLERIERGMDARELRRTLPVGPKGTSIEFIRTAGKSGVIILQIAEPSKEGPVKRTQLAATPGRDLR